MNLELPQIEGSYKSASQIIRIVTETWGEHNLYCPVCDSDRLERTPANTRAVDFICSRCEESFQLKSSSRWDERRIVDASYDTMIASIRNNKTPNLFVLGYTNGRYVQNIILVPHFFFTESAVEKRTPLGPQARRAGWVGCNILLSHIAPDGKIRIVSGGVITDADEVRKSYQAIKPFAELDARLRGWTLDVLRAIRQLGKAEFSLQEVYTFESELQFAHPENRHIRDKVRQQLQILRDLGFLRFLGNGKYAIT